MGFCSLLWIVLSDQKNQKHTWYIFKEIVWLRLGKREGMCPTENQLAKFLKSWLSDSIVSHIRCNISEMTGEFKYLSCFFVAEQPLLLVSSAFTWKILYILSHSYNFYLGKWWTTDGVSRMPKWQADKMSWWVTNAPKAPLYLWRLDLSDGVSLCDKTHPDWSTDPGRLPYKSLSRLLLLGLLCMSFWSFLYYRWSLSRASTRSHLDPHQPSLYYHRSAWRASTRCYTMT